MNTPLIPRLGAAVVAVVCTLSSGQAAAYAQTYTTKASVYEWNPSLGTGTARPMISAGIMGALGCGASALNIGDEFALLAKCQLATPVNSTWPEKCSPAGLVVALKQRYQQNWLSSAQASQDTAMFEMISAAAQYGAPSIVPLYGAVDQWATLTKLYVDITINGVIVNKVWFYDSSYDTEENVQTDGLRIASGQVFRNAFFLTLGAPLVANDPFFGQYVHAHDPPVGANSPAGEVVVDPSRGAPLLADHERLTEELAAALVFDALDLAGLLGAPELEVLSHLGVADDARRVDERLPDGSPWSYYRVTIVDPDTGDVLAHVSLSAADGAFEQLHILAPRAPCSASRTGTTKLSCVR